MTGEKLLQEGDIIELVKGMKVSYMIPKHFAYSNHKGDFSLTKHTVSITGIWEYLAGKYVVTKTAFDGGSEGHDPYPNGHRVYCQNLEHRWNLDFYQSGCFNSLNLGVEAIGKAEIKWIVTQ